MPGTSGPNLGVVWGWAPHENGWGVGGFNPNFARLDALVHLAVLDRMNSPPSILPANGDRYIVGSAGAGAWAGHSDAIAVFVTTDWFYYVPKLGWTAWNSMTDSTWVFDGIGWVENLVVDDRFDFVSPADGDVIVYDDAINKFINVRPMRGVSFGTRPGGLLTADQPVFFHRFGFGFTIPANFAAYRGAGTTLGGTSNATANTVFRVQKALAASPVSFANAGTLTIGAGGVNLTAASSTGDIVYAQNDTIRILAPTVPDTGLTGVYGTVIGYET